MKIITLFLIPLLIFAMACPTQQTIASFVTIMGNAAAAIAAAENNPALATKIQTDSTAAAAAVTNWKAGQTPAQDAIQALNLLQDDLNLIPGTSQYTPLVVICIGAVESILALIPAPPTPVPAPATAARRSVSLTGAPKNAKQFKSQWNQVLKQHPEWTKIPTL